MEDKEWYTLQDIVELMGATYFKVRTTVGALRTAGVITARDKPTDRRVVEVNRESLPRLKQALLGE